MAAPRRNALGRGLDSLISMDDVPASGSTAINEIPLDQIQPNPEQPRTSFDEDALAELAASIRELGIIQPISLRKLAPDSYQIIAGERRYRAAIMAGLTSVPAYIRTANEAELTEMALIENIQREDLNAIEVALAFRKLIDTYHLTQDRLSERLGKKRATISNHLRLLKLPAEIQIGLRDRKLDMGHARALVSVSDPKLQLKLYNRILKEELTVRKVEELAREIQEDNADSPNPSAPKAAPSEHTRRAEGFFTKELDGFFPSPVKFSSKADGKGSITLKFNSDEELDRLMELFDKIRQ